MTTRVVSAVVSPPLDVAAPTEQLTVALQRLDAGIAVPERAHAEDAGVDLCTVRDVSIPPGGRALVGTGIALALPAGFVGLVHPRSGLATRLGLGVLNAPGTVDAGYRGEIKVCLVNHDRSETIELRRGDRIAQLLVQRVVQVRFTEVDRLPESERGSRGHGSSGVTTLDPTSMLGTTRSPGTTTNEGA
jgi:dUTP pyrophosphatase